METPNQSLAYGMMGGRGDGDLCEGGSCKVKEQRKPLWWGSGMRGAGCGVGGQDLSEGWGERHKNPSWEGLALVGGRVFRSTESESDQEPGEWGGGSLRDGSGLWSGGRGPGDDRKGAGHGAVAGSG